MRLIGVRIFLRVADILLKSTSLLRVIRSEYFYDMIFIIEKLIDRADKYYRYQFLDWISDNSSNYKYTYENY